MKQLLLTTLLCQIGLIVYSQSVKFPTENGKWCYQYYDEGNNQQYNWERCVEITGDTIIENKVYAKAEAPLYFTYWSVPSPYIFREENGKVFIWNHEGSTEHLAYDFNLTVQDTFTNSYYWGPPEEVTMVVNYIDTIIGTDGIERRQYYLEGDDNSTKWVEGIGDAYWPFWHPNYYGGTSLSGGYNFICFSDSTDINFITDGYNEMDCLDASPIKNTHQLLDIIIFPNPSNTLTTFLSEDKSIDHLYIYNLQGQVIYSTSVNDTQLELNLSSFISPGLYHCEIIGEDNSRATKKIVLLPN